MNKIIKQAFTLIELLVVIAIIGILSGLIIVSMSGVTNKATIAKAQVFSDSLKNSLLLNLVSEWDFDELTTAVQGTSIYDSWNNGNNMTLSTNSDGLDKLRTGTNCVSGKCLSFDGTDDYAYVSGSGSSTSNLAITGAITLSAWVKFNTTGTDMTIMARGRDGSGTADSGYALWRYSGTNRIYFDTYSTTTRDALTSSAIINDTNWHLITVTWDGTTNANTKKIYVDGTYDNYKTSVISVIGQPAIEFRIGKDGGGNAILNGLLDDMRVYNAVLPTSQIKEQYYLGLNSLLNHRCITLEEYKSKIDSLASF